MTRMALVKALIGYAEADGDGYFDAVQAAAVMFPRNLIEQLGQLVNGPVWDGDIISKADRGQLFDLGLAIRVCSKGQQGYTGATYTAYSIWSCLHERQAKPE